MQKVSDCSMESNEFVHSYYVLLSLLSRTEKMTPKEKMIPDEFVEGKQIHQKYNLCHSY